MPDPTTPTTPVVPASGRRADQPHRRQNWARATTRAAARVDDQREPARPDPSATRLCTYVARCLSLIF